MGLAFLFGCVLRKNHVVKKPQTKYSQYCIILVLFNTQEKRMKTTTTPLNQQQLTEALAKIDTAKLDAIWGKIAKNPKPGTILNPHKK